jgi:Domain of unknown function (DUF4333)
MSVSKTAALTSLALFGLGLSGCGDDESPATVDSTKVEQGIEQDLSTSAVKVTSASCPSDVEKQQGATFTCSVKLSNGATGKATVTQGAANNYTYAFKPGSVQVPGATADAAIEKSLAAQGAPNAVVNCPENIIVKVGTTVSCAVSGAQGAANGTVTYTFSEANGTVDPESVDTT